MKSMIQFALLLALIPSVAYAGTPWQSTAVYSLVLLVPVVASAFIANSKYRLLFFGGGIGLVLGCNYLVSFELNWVLFIAVSVTPFFLIPVAQLSKKTKPGSG